MAATATKKAQLIALDGTSGKPAFPDPFIVNFNPTTLKVAYTNNLETSQEKGSEQRQYLGKQSSELSVELIFDTTDVDPAKVSSLDWGDSKSRGDAGQGGGSDVDVRAFTARVVELMKKMETNPPASGDKAAPYRVRFVWGSFLFEGVLKSLTESLELFSSEGVPLRAILALAISEDKLEFTPGKASGGDSPLATATSGSTAAGLAVSVGLDPLAGKLVASMNGLDDVRSVPSNLALTLPSASGGASIGGGVSAGFSVGGGAGGGAGGSASFGVSLSLGGGGGDPGGFGGGGGLSLTIGGTGSAGLTASAGVGVSASAGFGIGIGGGIGLGLGIGIGGGIGGSLGGAGLNLGVSGGAAGGIAGTQSPSVGMPGAGSVGGPSAGGAPGAQALMDPEGRVALIPAPKAPPLPPPGALASGGADTTRASASPGSGTPVSGAIGLSSSPASSVSGLPAPLPAQASAQPQGAFKGISGIPLKSVRFGVSAPAVRPLAYRRLEHDHACLEPLALDAQAKTARAKPKHAKKKGCCRGCDH